MVISYNINFFYIVNGGEGVFKDLLVPFYTGVDIKNVRTEIKNTEDNLLFNLSDNEKRNALYTDDYNFRLALVNENTWKSINTM